MAGKVDTAAEIAVQFARITGDGADVPAPAPPSPPDFLERRAADELRLAVAELKRRRVEALRLYEPLPLQAAFHASMARQRIIRGSNRSGKTIAAAVEVARALTGTDPFAKYPERDGRVFAVGLDLMFVAQVFFRKLFRAGAFKMIRDAAAGDWRAYRPWDEADRPRAREARPAPPLIPQRLIDTVSWEDKGKGIPKLVKLTTGWEIAFFASGSNIPQGMDLDLVWFSEELEGELWYPEMAARLLDRKGRFVWDATPQAGTDKLLELSERAEKCRGAADPPVEEFVALLAENPHIEEEEKALLADLLDDDEARVRIGGEFAAHGLRVFPEFNRTLHGRDVEEVPAHWTRYMAVDPGRQVCAVLFAAVPPPGEQPFEVLLYRELYLRACSAAAFGEAAARAAAGDDFEAFVMDAHMGRQTEMGSGLTVEYQYGQALARHKVASRRTRHGFIPGMDDPYGGTELIRDYLRVNPDSNCPRLVYLRGQLPNFVVEMARYRYKRQGRVVTDQPETRGAVHMPATLRYLLGVRPKFVRRTGKARGSAAYQSFQAKQAKRRKAEGGGGVRLGPGRGST